MQSLHNYHMSCEKVVKMYDKIVDTRVEKRKEIQGIGKDRGDIIAAGLTPLKVLLDVIEAPVIMISGNGLREGLFFEKYFQIHKQPYIVEDVLGHSIQNTLNNYDVNIQHSMHVQKLALALFDQLQTLHGMDKFERSILAVAAQLHDVGMYVDYYNHHKHGFYLTLNTKIDGLTHRELVMCAFIVGMHRITDLKQSWREYNEIIDKKDYEMIKKLALFVRIAEKLDRNEYGIVESITCHVTDKCIEIKVEATNTAELEIIAAMQNNKAFEKLFNRKLYIV